MKKILVTGAAGFIGFHLIKTLLKNDCFIYGIDNLNDYYDPKLKSDRLKELGINISTNKYGEEEKSTKYSNFIFAKESICNRDFLFKIFAKESFDYVVNLAAQAGVRFSIENPQSYIDSNIIGYFNILECCRHFPVKHLVYASSSSVYGNSLKVPFEESDMVDNPISLYAASKKSNELMAHAYSHLFHIPTTGLRFFTVYGPWGRPDMAYYNFAKLIIQGQKINVYNDGKLSRDFTYIDDVIDGIVNVLWSPSSKKIPYEIFNLGKGSPIELSEFISTLEDCLSIKARKNYLPMQQGDVEKTWCGTQKYTNKFPFTEKVDLKNGIKEFVKWYLSYYNDKLQ